MSSAVSSPLLPQRDLRSGCRVLFEDAHKGLGLIDANAIFFHRFTDDSVPYPADNSKQQQLFEKSDGHENDAKMIAGAHIVTLMASATILAPSAPSPFDARLRAVIAPHYRRSPAQA